MQTLSILGSTGSIGQQTLEVVGAAEGRFAIYALTAGQNVKLMAEQIRRYKPVLAVMMQESAAYELKKLVCDLPVRIEYGMAGLLAAVEAECVNKVVTAVSGRIGLEPTLAAIKAGKAIALANKETLVAAGDLVMNAAREHDCLILPVDSEHSAVFQCMEDKGKAPKRILLTASGGPFFQWPLERLQAITPAEALKHPNWSMGAKITIDSATMMNKGLEVIEAHHLFGMEYDKIEVLIHPQSIIHSMVEYCDGSVLAQLGRPDMRLPIQYALDYPVRHPSPWERLDLKGKSLSFYEPENARFPAVNLAYWAGKKGGTMPAVMNAANEIAVQAFLNQTIAYLDIIKIVSQVCEEHRLEATPDLAAILQADKWARLRTWELTVAQ